MRSYFAVSDDDVVPGGLVECIEWAFSKVAGGVEVVQIATAKPGDRFAMYVLEVDDCGVRRTGRRTGIELKNLLRRVKADVRPRDAIGNGGLY